MLLDQDSDFSEEYLTEYENKYQEYGDSHIYAPLVVDRNKTKVYSPARLEYFVGHALPYSQMPRATLFSLERMSVINSGLLIPLAVFEKVGGFNEKIKLDFSDIYFIESYKKYNSTVILLDIDMVHSLSGDEGNNFDSEISRFGFYCTGAKELAKALHASTNWSAFRRMVRLILKYKSLAPVLVFYKFFLK